MLAEAKRLEFESHGLQVLPSVFPVEAFRLSPSNATPTMSLLCAFASLCGTLADDDAGAIVLPVVTRGMIEPSAMRRFSIP